MSKYIPDIKTQRWVIITPGRTKRPDDTVPVRSVCPFCEGNEGITPPEVFRIGGGAANMPGWQVRVVPNLFPITDTHEVIIHSADDTKDIEELPIEQVERILFAYRARYQVHVNDGQILIFCNHGTHAGASLKHPHSQLVVIPRQINLDALSREPITHIVDERKYFVTYCPDFSQWPFEMWIVPNDGVGRFGEISDEILSDLARSLQGSIQRIAGIYKNPGLSHVYGSNPFGYNYYISTGVNWFIRIIPRFVHRAGFELGTGLSVNIVDPADAADLLKKALSPDGF